MKLIPIPELTNEGSFAHNTPFTILRETFRSALIVITCEGDDNANFSRTDMLLINVRPSDFSGSSIVNVAAAQVNTGTPGEITSTSYAVVADAGTLNATVTATVTRGNGRGGRFKVAGFQLA